MPSLANTLRSTSPEGYAPAPPALALPAPVSQTNQSGLAKINPYLRCPLPPINAGPDTLRQFNENSDVPHRRVLPLPANTGGGGGTTINNTTVISESSSSSASSSSTPTLTPETVYYTSPTLAVGGLVQTSLTLAALSFQLISLTSTAPCEVRIYGSAAAQIADATRATDTPLAAEVSNNIISDVVLDTAPYAWYWQNRVGANSNTPQSTSLYVTVINLSADTSVRPRLTFVLLPLET